MNFYFPDGKGGKINLGSSGGTTFEVGNGLRMNNDSLEVYLPAATLRGNENTAIHINSGSTTGGTLNCGNALLRLTRGGDSTGATVDTGITDASKAVLKGIWDFSNDLTNTRATLIGSKRFNYFDNSRVFLKGATLVADSLTSIQGNPLFPNGLNAQSLTSAASLDVNHAFADSLNADYVTITGGLNTADSVNVTFGYYSSIRAASDSINVGRSYVKANDINFAYDNASLGAVGSANTVYGDYTFPNTHLNLEGADVGLNQAGVELKGAIVWCGRDGNYDTSITGSPYFTDGLVLGTASSTQDGAIWFVP